MAEKLGIVLGKRETAAEVRILRLVGIHLLKSSLRIKQDYKPPDNPSFFATARAVGVHHQTAQRCVERAAAFGAMAALEDLPRPGPEPRITDEARAWIVNLACRKAKDLGYPHEL